MLPLEGVYSDKPQHVYQDGGCEVCRDVEQDSTKDACVERNPEVDQMVAEAEFQQ